MANITPPRKLKEESSASPKSPLQARTCYIPDVAHRLKEDAGDIVTSSSAPTGTLMALHSPPRRQLSLKRLFRTRMPTRPSFVSYLPESPLRVSPSDHELQKAPAGACTFPRPSSKQKESKDRNTKPSSTLPRTYDMPTQPSFISYLHNSPLDTDSLLNPVADTPPADLGVDLRLDSAAKAHTFPRTLTSNESKNELKAKDTVPQPKQSSFINYLVETDSPLDPLEFVADLPLDSGADQEVHVDQELLRNHSRTPYDSAIAGPLDQSPSRVEKPSKLLSDDHKQHQAEQAFIHLLQEWPMTEPIDENLNTHNTDTGSVEDKAVQWVNHLSVDDIMDLLPQLTQSLKHDWYLTSAIAEVMLRNAKESPLLAHHLYWNLHTLTQSGHDHQRIYKLQQELCMACSKESSHEWAQEVKLFQTLRKVALSVKASKDNQRQVTLVNELQKVSFPPVFRLPFDYSTQCSDIDIQSCYFFKSKTVPLKLSFRNAKISGPNIDAIFKVGDDLRQDMLTLQIIELMNKLWLMAELDLKMVTYKCLATSHEEGLVEMISDSSTLRQIQTEGGGVMGSFKDKLLTQWLIRHSSSLATLKQAIENFTHSCAGCCVATYVLGICDRHNDNIMVCKTGHMFHIDFGRIFGNVQKFGAFNRDRVPFVLTPDMAYVINAGDKQSVRFQKFVDLCCKAYNQLRKHSHLLLSLISLMLSDALSDLSDDVHYVRNALLPELSDEEATHIFTNHIKNSLGSLAVPINFFFHNLTQFKIAASNTSGGLLSISPSSHSIATDGKIESAIVIGYHMKFYPSKHIVYQIEVTRVDSVTYCFRRFSEFTELHKKLMELSEDLPQLPSKTFLPGQSITCETGKRRQNEFSCYLKDLLKTKSTISESDLIYTFLHCLIHDEQYMTKIEENELSGKLNAEVQLDLSYSKEQERLSVMVKHVKELMPLDGSDTLDPYVKLYLLPDPQKLSKRKTETANKTLNPTYNQMIYYDIKQDRLADHCLELSVWAKTPRSKCLGCVLINPTNKEVSTWFELKPPLQ